jgi:hypothetical protein
MAIEAARQAKFVAQKRLRTLNEKCYMPQDVFSGSTNKINMLFANI